MRLKLFIIICFYPVASWCQTKKPAPDLLQYVQPLVGTANSTTNAATKHGEGTERLANTIPAVGVPFGMTQWTAQTRNTEQKCIAPYYYKDQKISGFRGTHWLSGSCTQDYGSVTIVPVIGRLKTTSEDYAFSYSHQDEITAPDYYSVQTADKALKIEFTALARSSIFQITMNKADSLYLLIIPNSDKGKGFVSIDHSRREITGYNPAHRLYQGLGKQAGFSGHFVIQVDKPFSKKGTFINDEIFPVDSISNKMNIGAFIGFNLKKGELVRIRVGTSFSSIEQARKNLSAELPGWDFNWVRKQAGIQWQNALQKIQVTSRDKRKLNIFYTAFYHAMQHPRLFNDVDGTYPKFAHDYELTKLTGGRYFDDFSMWDIYRAQLPLLEILDPPLINDMAASIVLKGQQGGWLPIFPCWNSYTSAMVGDHAIAFLASAWMKGIKDFDMEDAYRLMRQNAFESPSEADYIEGKGRRALRSYLKYGYIPIEDSVREAFHKKEQVSRTLEYAFDDYALAQIAKSLHKEDDYKKLMERAGNFKNVFDTSVSFVRGRYADGSWYVPFNPDIKLPFITEGTARQYTFYVPHDTQGLTALLGGKKMLENSLDTLFAKGEYWHGNEPGHQVPFLYNFTASPWKTQREVSRIMEEEYTDGAGGLSGNDDAGQMSAWYVFAAMGLYPVNPVSDEYVLCAPIFDELTILLPAGKKMQIITRRKTATSTYIRSVKLNGVYNKGNFIRHAELMKGGKLELELSEPLMDVIK